MIIWTTSRQYTRLKMLYNERFKGNNRNSKIKHPKGCFFMLWR
nr:MAG TPA: hypothetical protein [Caudoviricetes sp.]